MGEILDYNDWAAQLPDADTLTGTELIAVVQNGITKKTNWDAVANFVRPYKVYSALISQSGTDDPTVKVLENKIGVIVWTRTGVGSYIGTLAGAFTLDKTFTPQPQLPDDPANFISLTEPTINNVSMHSYVNGSLSDDVMVDTAIEIKVYL